MPLEEKLGEGKRTSDFELRFMARYAIILSNKIEVGSIKRNN